VVDSRDLPAEERSSPNTAGEHMIPVALGDPDVGDDWLDAALRDRTRGLIDEDTSETQHDQLTFINLAANYLLDYISDNPRIAEPSRSKTKSASAGRQAVRKASVVDWD
jgi:hypothetical protein